MFPFCWNPAQSLTHLVNLHTHPRGWSSNLRYFFEDFGGHICNHIFFKSLDELEKAIDDNRSKRWPNHRAFVKNIAIIRKKFVLKGLHIIGKTWETFKKRMPLVWQRACCGQDGSFLLEPLVMRGGIKESFQKSKTSTWWYWRGDDLKFFLHSRCLETSFTLLRSALLNYNGILNLKFSRKNFGLLNWGATIRTTFVTLPFSMSSFPGIELCPSSFLTSPCTSTVSPSGARSPSTF